MFDDLNKAGGAQGPAPVEDIFGGTDKVKERPIIKPAVLQPKDQVLAAVQAPVAEHIDYETGHGKKFFVLGLIILIIAGLGYGGYWTLGKYGQSLFKKNEAPAVKEEANVPAAADVQNNVQTPSAPEIPAAAAENTSIPAAEKTAEIVATPVNSDQDGLTDDEEINIYHTNPNSADTDGDGLFDREEVKVYHTDPNKADTDGDGFSDGAEVKAGYNPNGPGKLYELNK